MKKRSRILAYLLIVCLIIASVSVIASALTENTGVDEIYKSQLTPSKATNTIADYDGEVAWGGSSQLKYHFASIQSVSASGDKYIKLKYKADGTADVDASADAYRELVITSNKNAVTEYSFVNNNAINHKHVSLDFDFCATGYVVKTTENGKTVYTTYDELPEGISPNDANVNLSLISGSAMQSFVNFWKTNPATITEEVKPSTASTSIYILKDSESGIWYYSNASSLSSATKTIAMSNEPGVYDHITVTYTVRTDSNGKYTIMTDYFVNGEFLYEKSCVAFTNAATALTLRSMNLTIPKAYSAYDSYSYGIDNLRPYKT